MIETKTEDINQHGGWVVQVGTPGALPRYFRVYEADKDKAVALAKIKIPVFPGETATAVAALNIHALNRANPGGVKQHV